MRPNNDNLMSSPHEKFPALVLAELGRSLRVSLKAALSEPLPRNMGLLLLRLALVEVMRHAAEEEAHEACRDITPEQRGTRGRP